MNVSVQRPSFGTYRYFVLIFYFRNFHIEGSFFYMIAVRTFSYDHYLRPGISNWRPADMIWSALGALGIFRFLYIKWNHGKEKSDNERK